MARQAEMVGEAEATQPEAEQAPILVVDVRKRQKRRQVKRLRRGKGRLLEKVQAMVAELRASKTIAPGAQAVVLVVREKDRPFGY